MLARVSLRGIWLALPMVAACNFEHGVRSDASTDPVVDDSGVNIDVDAPPADARPDSPPGQNCYGVGLLQVCYQPGTEPTAPYHPTFATVDTGSGCDRVIPQSGNNPDLCLHAGTTVTIDTNVRFTGPRPIVLLALTTMTVSGTIDVSSGGAGAGTGFCNNPSKGTDELSNGSSKGAGGGGGAGFGTGGAAGGSGTAAGGGGASSTALTGIRGGCKGAPGGNSASANGGAGGVGAGAVYMIAGTSISVSGTIRANGQGGRGGGAKAGGGGGGTGGLIGFDSPQVTVQGTVMANGGGGGEGGDSTITGENGSDPTQWDQRATGGNNLQNGGDGGAGSVAGNGGVIGGNGANGGGGGGGGAGRVKRFPFMTTPGKISPPPL
jgi:hypothetical protein